MDASEVKRRATTGALLLTARGVVARILGFGSSIVLARLLVPEDFGLVAIGLAANQFAWLISDAGVGAALLRRPEPPSREELRAILGFQLLITIALASATILVTLLLGKGAPVVAVVVVSLPMMAYRVPGALLLERELSYRPLASVQIVETLAYYLWAVTTVVLGSGVWGLASASIVQALAGSVLIMRASPMRIVVPMFRFAYVKPFLGFGWRYQAAGAVQVIQTQGASIGVAAIGGVASAGLWSLAVRIILAPYLLFRSLWRVSYPGMARLIAAGESPAPVVKRGVSLVGIAAGAMYAPLIGSAPAMIPGVFGDKWEPVVDVIPTACLGLMIIVPISVAAQGYLYAIGDAGVVLRRNIVQAVVYLGLGLPLVVPLGIAAFGVSGLITAIIGAVIMDQAVKQRMGTGLIWPLATPVGVAIAAAAGGWVVASGAAPSVSLAIETALLSELLFLVGIAVTQRSAVTDLLRIGRRSIRNAVASPSHG